jgi:hypothetical protein
MRWVSRSCIALALCAAYTSTTQAAILNAESTSNNGGSPGWAIFFDVSASGGQALTITDMTTASTAAAGGAFTVEVFTRTGTALGGPVTTGPGSSLAGWTSLGTAPATQGPALNGISQTINIPDIAVPASGTVGVAVLFTGAGPRYLGTGTPPYSNFDDGALHLTTGDGRSQPFTTGGSWFASRALTGSLTYTAVPEPASIAMLASVACLAIRRRRRR